MIYKSFHKIDKNIFKYTLPTILKDGDERKNNWSDFNHTRSSAVNSKNRKNKHSSVKNKLFILHNSRRNDISSHNNHLRNFTYLEIKNKNRI